MQSRSISRRDLFGWAVAGAAVALPSSAGADQTPQTNSSPRFGLIGPIGPQAAPKPSPAGKRRWEIVRPGVYENYLVDLEFADDDAVRIRADGVVLRHCEIRNGRRDAIEVYADDVTIEGCRIQFFLNGTFQDQRDSHGVTGRSQRLTIRNCEISYCSGDGWQMDPGRGPWSDVIIEHCHIWTAPLPHDAAGFRRGEQPGENGVDTKQSPDNPRSSLTIRNSVFHGYRAAGYIDRPAALNIKENVQTRIENCVFYDNHLALRLRGPGPRGGAQVSVRDCYFYDCDLAIRMESQIENLQILNPSFGHGVKQRYQHVGGKPPGLKIEGEREAPPREALLEGKAN